MVSHFKVMWRLVHSTLANIGAEENYQHFGRGSLEKVFCIRYPKTLF